MRKITQDAISAFRNNRKFKRGNTEVKVMPEGRFTELCLHGNTIAIAHGLELYVRDGGWKTVTTKERLNGLPNVHIVQRNFQWFLNGEAWDGELIKVE